MKKLIGIIAGVSLTLSTSANAQIHQRDLPPLATSVGHGYGCSLRVNGKVVFNGSCKETKWGHIEFNDGKISYVCPDGSPAYTTCAGYQLRRVRKGWFGVVKINGNKMTLHHNLGEIRKASATVMMYQWGRGGNCYEGIGHGDNYQFCFE